MMRKLLLLVTATILAVAGLAGLLLPLLPGVPLLAGALLLACAASPATRAALEHRLAADARYHPLLKRWRQSSHLPVWQRARLALWLGLAALTRRRT